MRRDLPLGHHTLALHSHCAAAAATTQAALTLVCRWPPCQGTATLAASVAAPTSGCPIADLPYGRRVASDCAHGRRPPQRPSRSRSCVAAPVRGLAMARLPCKGSGRGRLPLLLATFAAKMQ
ncbi:hypothetical protein GW17_00030284 [Ensete ventricosum]|nr:hypothetical protein GW17_00030284 [Ensete ventricosum]